MAIRLVALIAALAVGATGIRTRASSGQGELRTAGARVSVRDTPVTRVVKLLEGMQSQMNKDLEEDEELYKKLACWCNNNEYEKTEAVEDAENKIEELGASIEQLTARSAELNIEIKKTEKDVADAKQALAAATAMRDKEVQEAHGQEMDDVQALENLKAAITVLSKHHDAALPQLSISLLALGNYEDEQGANAARSLDMFMSTNDFSMDDSATVPVRIGQHSLPGITAPQVAPAPPVARTAGWSSSDLMDVRKGLRTAAVFSQAQHGTAYYPAYESSSGEILGILRQMQDEMGTDLAEAQKVENERAKAFGELRAAKSSFISGGEKRAEEKEDELAQTDMGLAEAKEDLKLTKTALAADQKFLANLKKTCGEADANFELRKKARLQELQAVSETIQILTGDEARDAMSGTFKEGKAESFTQLSSGRRAGTAIRLRMRQKAAALLRRAAATSRNSELAALASSVELDAFAKVKKAIDDMISNLKVQQEDEVKKHDWCNSEIQKTEMATMKTEEQKSDTEASMADLEAKLKNLADEIKKAQKEVSDLQVGLQRASEDRKVENLDFQKTIEDQTLTIEVLHKALNRLATFYDEEALLQTRQKQTPPVPQKEFKKSAGAGGVMSMIEKLIYEAKDIMADSRKGEVESQLAYEDLVTNTNESVAALMKEIMGKKKALGRTRKDLHQKKEDLLTTVDDLERLHKYDADMHAECDYLLKNFDARQQARAEETESLQQAKQILSGADLA